MEYSEQVVEVLSKAVVKALDQRLAEYDIHIDKKLQNFVFSTGNLLPLSVTGEQIASGTIVGANIANGTITGANIVGMTITGDLIVDGTLTGAKIQNGTISTKALIAQEVTTDVMNAVVANIATANIDWANVHTINADHAVVVEAVISQLESEKITTGELVASLSTVGTAIIKDATIDAAHIKDISADVALIDRSVEGKTFIRDLSVGDANIVSLLVDKLFVRDDDGNTYNIFVNGDFDPESLTPEERAKLPIITKRIQLDGGGVMHDSLPAGAIVRNSITANEINAGALFADEAFVVSLTAGIGNFGTLFANQAIVGQLKTHLIQSDFLTIKIQDEIARKDGVNLLTNTSVDEKIASVSGWGLYSIGSVDINNTNGLVAGKHVVFRTHLRPLTNMWRAVIAFTLSGSVGAAQQASLLELGLQWIDHVGAVAYSDPVVVSEEGDWATVTSIIPPNAVAVQVYIQNDGDTSDTAYYHSPKLEEGTVPTSSTTNGFNPENWETIRNTVMTLNQQGIAMQGGLIHMIAGSMQFEADTTMTMNAGSTMTLRGSTLNLIANANLDGTETDAALNIQSGSNLNIQSGGNLNIESQGALNIASQGSLNIRSQGALNIQSGGTLSLLSGSALEMMTGSDMTLYAGSKLSLLGADMEIASYTPSEGSAVSGTIKIKSGGLLSIQSGGSMTMDSAEMRINAGNLYMYGASNLYMNAGSMYLGSVDEDGNVLGMGNLYVRAGEIDIQAKGSLVVSTGSRFIVDADDDDSYIRFGGTPQYPNFLLGKQGIIKAQSGYFGSITVDDMNIVQAVPGSLTQRIFVGTKRPTNQSGYIWIAPSAVANVEYEHQSAGLSMNGATYTRTLAFSKNGDTVAGSTCTYGIQFRIYNYDANAGGTWVTVILHGQDINGASKSITLLNHVGTGTVYKGSYVKVDTLKNPSAQLTNLTYGDTINVQITLSKSNSVKARFATNTTFKLVCKGSSTSELQTCTVTYVS